MPQPPAGQDYYLVIGLSNTSAEVAGATQVFVATGTSEESAVAKVHALLKPGPVPEGTPPPPPAPTLYLAQVAPTFSPPA